MTHPHPRPPVRLVALIVALLAWGAVAYIELHHVPNEWLLSYVVPPLEATVWLVAIGTTVYLATIRFLPDGLTRAVLALAMAVLFLHFNNWSMYEPRSYYETHRGSFAQIAELVRSGEAGHSDEYYGEELPLRLADLSTDGRAAKVGEQDGKPVVFVPAWLGIPDDAGGYLYFDGTPRPDTFIDLYGRPMDFSQAQEIGEGWWYA